ncbi:hypothetical protein [Streptomyces sp. UNOC14_S4]|uniref:hypothetical protein n=1 Tax=Streptomyces sp. UNOC14_S4 TaxID=2872340 RepID=UPI001E363557|nr:hypothetical protein [Streptomyces sp. UNOC14_S4]MCC3773076.1 hypothetical protein [Streptomyces sp. UNOC14_S4]
MPPDHTPRTPRARGTRRQPDRNTPQFTRAGTRRVQRPPSVTLSATLSVSGFLALLIPGVLLVSPVVPPAAVDPVAAGILLAAVPTAGRLRVYYRRGHGA